MRLSRSPSPSFHLGSSRGATPDCSKGQRLASPDGKVLENIKPSFWSLLFFSVRYFRSRKVRVEKFKWKKKDKDDSFMLGITLSLTSRLAFLVYSEKREYVLRLQTGEILAVSLVFCSVWISFAFFAQRCKTFLPSQALYLKLSGFYIRVRNGTERQTPLKKKMKLLCQATKRGLEIIRVGHQALALFAVVERRKWTYGGEFRALVGLFPRLFILL